MKSIAALLSTSLTFPALALPAPVEPSSEEAHGPSECPVTDDRRDAVCMRVAVFENREAQTGREIDLHVVILPAKGNETAPDPLFVIMGGPGQAAAPKASYFSNYFARINQDRDLVFVDVRGTGDSNPLDFEVGPDDLMGELKNTLAPGLVQRELKKLQEHADLTQYTTNHIVDDLEEVREALGYEKVNLFGASYGTRVVQIYLRRHGGSVRTAVMKGVAPSGFAVGLNFAQDAQNSLEALFADCSADPECAQAYPRLEERFAELFTKIKEDPIELNGPHPRTGERLTFPLDPSTLALTVREMLYASQTRAMLPGMVTRAWSGNANEWGPMILLMRQQMIDELHEGMALSVVGAEDLPLLTKEAIEAAAPRDSFLGSGFASDLSAAARHWPHAEMPASFWEPVRSDVPTLLISGRLDPVTPPSAAERAAEGLTNSRHLIFHAGAHGDAPFRPCLEEILADFYASGTLERLDTACADRVRPASFVTPR